MLDSEVALCYVSGDPHYRTFDGKMMHYQGMCTFDMATPLEEYPGLPYFSVVTRNERRYGSTTVSYLRYVEVHVFGHVVRMEKNKEIYVSRFRVSPMWMVATRILTYRHQ